jgi:allophanate hydrolase
VTVFAIYGTFRAGQGGHENLEDAELLGVVTTAPAYRLYLVDGRWPALVPAGDGVSIECELYECSDDLLVRLAELEPAGWNRAPLELADGRRVEAFVCDPEVGAKGVDVSEYGSWPAFLAGR